GRTLTRQVESATGEGNQSEMTLHFGLGEHADPVELQVTWPGGATRTIATDVDRLVAVAPE
ncbi:MAG TPA: ASPIC/UnbV domain-containing protein, partial [Armatimonadota bacterium]|nr:ASPIC/UnbV domain-containing protein [Armatimonadota bacterium]